MKNKEIEVIENVIYNNECHKNMVNKTQSKSNVKQRQRKWGGKTCTDK
jgi:hypothetical protein